MRSRQLQGASAALLLLVGLASLADAYLPKPEAMRLCRARTGLTDKDIESYKTRNENCAVDCITKQGTIMTAFTDDGTACHDQDGYKCVLGKCRSSEDKLDDEIAKTDLYRTQIGIKSAYVADRDPYPGQGESDAFVVVELVSDGQPNISDGEVLCHTHVIQDTSRPKWNYVCKPLPMKGSARLRFVVLDSDKPDTDPQLLGSSVQTLDSIMNNGVRTITLDQGSLAGGPYWLELDISGSKYNPSDV